MEKIKAFFDKNLFEYGRTETPGELIFYKIFELFIIGYVIHLSFYWGQYVERISDVVLPLGLAIYIDVSFMFGTTLPIWNAAIITGLVTLGYFRIAPAYTYSIAMLLFHWQHVVRFSQGEIPHSANLIGMTLLAFAVAHVCFKERMIIRRFSMGFIFFFTGLGYTSAGISKLIGTGWNWADGKHLWMWMSEKSVDILSRTGEFDFNWLQNLAFEYYWIATIILLVGWVTEILGFTMWFKKARIYIFTATIAMHFGITLTMNIRFDAFVYQLILIGYPWYKGINYLLKEKAGNNLLTKFSERFG